MCFLLDVILNKLKFQINFKIVAKSYRIGYLLLLSPGAVRNDIALENCSVKALTKIIMYRHRTPG